MYLVWFEKCNYPGFKRKRKKKINQSNWITTEMLGVAQRSPNTFATFQSSFTYFSQYAQQFAWPYVKKIKCLRYTGMVKKPWRMNLILLLLKSVINTAIGSCPGSYFLHCDNTPQYARCFPNTDEDTFPDSVHIKRQWQMKQGRGEKRIRCPRKGCNMEKHRSY